MNVKIGDIIKWYYKGVIYQAQVMCFDIDNDCGVYTEYPPYQDYIPKSEIISINNEANV